MTNMYWKELIIMPSHDFVLTHNGTGSDKCDVLKCWK
jgi:hypothetical protein